MLNVKAVLKNVWPYQMDKMDLPVKNVDAAIPFYLDVLGFQLLSKENNLLSAPYWKKMA
jgi:lactoylglutathione lyase